MSVRTRVPPMIHGVVPGTVPVIATTPAGGGTVPAVTGRPAGAASVVAVGDEAGQRGELGGGPGRRAGRVEMAQRPGEQLVGLQHGPGPPARVLDECGR